VAESNLCSNPFLRARGGNNFDFSIPKRTDNNGKISPSSAEALEVFRAAR
jgi:hypothetical protein